MEMEMGEEEEDEKQVSDLLVVAKFAAFGVQPAAQDDPCEIDLDEVVPYVKPPRPVAEPQSSSSSESESESEQEDRAMDDDGDEDEDNEDDARMVSSLYVPYLESAPPAVLADSDVIVPDALVITAIQAKSNLVVASAVDKTFGRPHILDSGSVVCLNAARQVVGRIDDVFGPVDLPYYTIVCLEARIAELELQVGHRLGRVENQTQLVNVHQLDRHGIDAGEEDGDGEDGEDSDGAAKPRPLTTTTKPPRSTKPRPAKKRLNAAKPKLVPTIPAPAPTLPPHWPGQ